MKDSTWYVVRKKVTHHVPRTTFTMTEEFDIQCESCGTIYSHLEDVCPYCGEPQPLGLAHERSAMTPDSAYPDYAPAENPYYDQQPYAAYPADVAYTDDEFLPDELEGQYGGYETDAGYEPGYEAYPTDYAETGYYPEDEPYPDEETFPEYGGYDQASPAEFEDETYLEEDTQPRRFTKRRTLLGCLGILLCIGLMYGSIGIFAAYRGLQEQVSEKQTEAQDHFERGQEHLTNNSLDLAIAEFEMALSLNPALLEAREALREARRLAQAKPTPTSETRSAAAASIIEKAETEIEEKKWLEAAETLAQIRDLDPNFQAERVSELLYTANFELGQQLTTPDNIDEALAAFERALAERPDDPEATVEQAKAALYVQGKAAVDTDKARAIKAFDQLYREDAEYLDVETQLLQAYEAYGDELAEQEAWCLAETQYLEASELKPSSGLKVKADASSEKCAEVTLAEADSGALPLTPQATAAGNGSTAGGVAAAPRLTPTVAAANNAAPAASGGSGSIYYSAFNPNEARWEILAVPASGGTPRVVALNGTMPAVSPDGRWLVYHSELIDAEGFHRLDLTTGEDARITQFQRHILPRWGSDSSRFLLVAQEPGTGRWQVQLGFVDGKSDPIILRDGRTPDWSATGLIAYQGTDAVGNNPGIYVVPFDGGEATRLTTHESDRSPDFSPDGSQLAYMSTKDGNWNIYTISTAGSAPRQITNSPGQDGLPAWSPDGSTIAYVSDAGGGWAIYTVDAAGGTPFKVTAWDGVNLPDWLMAQIWWAR